MPPSDANRPPAHIDLHLHSQYSDGEGTIKQVVAEAAKRGISVMAFTDHTDVEGNFRFSRYSRRDFAAYLADIRDVRALFPGLNIWVGIEITKNFGPIPDSVESIFKACDIILVDGYYVTNPVQSAQRIRDWCDISHIFIKNIGISHPKFDKLEPPQWSTIARSKIFLELNNSKINNVQIAGIERYLSQPTSQTVLWSVGSDAHSLPRVGDVSIAWGIIHRFQLYKNLIVPVSSVKT